VRAAPDTEEDRGDEKWVGQLLADLAYHQPGAHPANVAPASRQQRGQDCAFG